MPHDLVISGTFVDPLLGMFSGWVGCSGGKIAEVSAHELKGRQAIRAPARALVFPGFIDPHVHCREPGWEQKEDFLTASRAALHGGVTTIIDMPNNREPAVTKELIERKIALARKALVDVEFFGGALPEHLDGIHAMAPLVRGYKVFLGQTTGGYAIDRKQLPGIAQRIAKTGLPAVFHCFDPEEGCIREIGKLAEQHRLRPHIAHLSTAAGMEEAIRWKTMTCEATPHHLVFNEESKGELLTMMPWLRKKEDSAQLLEGLRSGKIQMLATDHAPHTLEEKKQGAKGLPGLDVYGNVAAWLLWEQGVGEKRVAVATSYEAAQRFGLGKKGRVAEGYAADFAVLEQRPETVDQRGHYTKCGWSPYHGMGFPGRVWMTVKAGAVRCVEGAVCE